MMRAAAARTATEVEAPPRELPHVSCGRCGCAYSVRAWAALPKVRTLTADELHRHVIDWREERIVEVRSCAACGRAMARMVVRVERAG